MTQVRPGQTSSALREDSVTPNQECTMDDETDVLDGVFIGPMNTDAEEARRRAMLDALAQGDEPDDAFSSIESPSLSRGSSPKDDRSVGNEVTGVVGEPLDVPIIRHRHTLSSRAAHSPFQSSRPAMIQPPRMSLPVPPFSISSTAPSLDRSPSVEPEMPPAVLNACDPSMASSDSLLHPEYSPETFLADVSTHTAPLETNVSNLSASNEAQESYPVIGPHDSCPDAPQEIKVELPNSENGAPTYVDGAGDDLAEPMASASSLYVRCESEDIHLSLAQPNSLEDLNVSMDATALTVGETPSLDPGMSSSQDSDPLSAEYNVDYIDVAVPAPGVTDGCSSPTHIDLESNLENLHLAPSRVSGAIAAAIPLPKDFVMDRGPPLADLLDARPFGPSGIDASSLQPVQGPVAPDTVIPQAYVIERHESAMLQDPTALEERRLSLEASVPAILEDPMATEFPDQPSTTNPVSDGWGPVSKNTTSTAVLGRAAPIPRPNPFLASISPTNVAATPSNQVISHSNGTFNPFLPATPDSPSSPPLNASISNPPDPSIERVLPDLLVSSSKKRRAEPISHEFNEDSTLRPRKKARPVTHYKPHIIPSIKAQTIKGIISPTKRPRPSSPDTLELALREVDARRAAEARKPAPRPSSPSPIIGTHPTSFVRAGSPNPQRAFRQGVHDMPSLDARKAPSASTTKTVRPDVVPPRSGPSVSRTVSPVKSGPVKRQFPTVRRVEPTEKPIPSSPARPTAEAQASPLPSSPSPASRRVVNHLPVTPKSAKVPSSSPFRFPPVRIGAAPFRTSRPAGSMVNENVFQRGPGASPTRARFIIETGQATVASIAPSSVSISSPAKPVAARAGQKPSGIPVPRPTAGLSDSKLPRPVTIAKSSSDRKAFTFGAGNISTFAPMPTNAFLAHINAPSAPSTGSPYKAPLLLPPNSFQKSNVLVPSPSMREARVPTTDFNNPDRPLTPPLDNAPAPSDPHNVSEPHKPDFSSPVSDVSSSMDPINMSLSSRGLRRTLRRTSSLPPAFNDNVSIAKPPLKRKGLSSKVQQVDPRPLAAMTATALRTITTKHTRINEGHFNVLEIKVVLKDQPRPPSPGSKVRTVLQREREEAEQGRTARAKKRGLMRGLDRNQEGDENNATSPSSYTITPGAERPLKHPRAPGDDDEYSTPKRIRLVAQSAAIDHDDFISTRVPLLWDVEEEARLRKGKEKDVGSSSVTPPPLALTAKRKFVRWDKLLASDPESLPAPSNKSSSSQPEGPPAPTKSALAKDPSSYDLDIFGNAINTEEPLNNLLTKSRVVVTKVVYNDDQEALADPIVKKALKEAKGFSPSAPD